MYDKLDQTGRISLPYSTSLQYVTVIHSCPFCALNVTFTRQAIIVYFYLCSKFQLPRNLYARYQILMSKPIIFLPITSVCTLMTSNKINTAVCCLRKKSKWLLHFSKFLNNPNFNLEINYIYRKPIKRRFQRCIGQTEILWNFLTWTEYIYLSATQRQIPY